MTGTVQLSDTLVGDHVTSRQVTVTVNGAALPPIEAISSPAAFQCADGDAITVVAVDINAAGPSAPSATFSTTAHLPVTPPVAPTVTAVVFS
jgi:hypothetical protein